MTARCATRLALFLALSLGSALPALAATLTRLEVAPPVARLGAPVEFTVFKTGRGNCGFQIQTGEGRIGPFGFPGASKRVSHTYSRAGSFDVRVSGARHGSKPACGGSPALVRVVVGEARLLEEVDVPRATIRRASPSPAIVGQAVTITGEGFGRPGEMELLFGSYDDLRRIPLGGRQVRSWSDREIVVVPPYETTGTHFFLLRPPPPPLPPGGGLVATAGRDASINVEVAMPRPAITGYRPAGVCPGSTLVIQGRNFTELRGGFTLLWQKVGAGSISMRDERIRSWSDAAIHLQVPTDLPAYIAPGDRFRIDLGVRNDRGLEIVARGREGRLGERCGDQPTPRIPGVGPVLGTKHGLTFTLAPVNRRVAMGQNVVFGGTFETTSTTLASRLRTQPMKILWRIEREGEVMARGAVPAKGRRTPLLVRAKATKAGTYRLVLEPANRPRDVSFRADLGEAWVRIVQMERLDPRKKIELEPRKRNLPQGLEPRIRP